MVTSLVFLFAASDVPFAGRLFVEPTTPGAQIFVDGLQCEHSPCEVEVTAGRHEVTVRKEGYETRKTIVNVKAEEREFVNVKLFPLLKDDEARNRVANNVRIAAFTTLGASVAGTASALLMYFAAYEPARRAYFLSAGAAPEGPSQQAFDFQAARNRAGYELDRMQIATVGLAIGSGILLGTSIGLFVLGPKPGSVSASTSTQVTMQPVIGPGQLGLNMTY